MTTPESAEQAAKERSEQDPPPAGATEQVQGEGEVGAEGLERRDREP
jgi:hypothetical protein